MTPSGFTDSIVGNPWSVRPQPIRLIRLTSCTSAVACQQSAIAISVRVVVGNPSASRSNVRQHRPTVPSSPTSACPICPPDAACTRPDSDTVSYPDPDAGNLH
ncbi:hypothetical protein ACLOJK_003506 [Asimina triloba]